MGNCASFPKSMRAGVAPPPEPPKGETSATTPKEAKVAVANDLGGHGDKKDGEDGGRRASVGFLLDEKQVKESPEEAEKTIDMVVADIIAGPPAKEEKETK